MNMSSCPHTEKILDYQCGLLTRQEASELEEHLKSCALCQRELQLESVIEKTLQEELQPGYIEENILTGVRIRKVLVRPRFGLYTLRMVIYAAVAFILGLNIIPVLMRFFTNQYFSVTKYSTWLSNLLGHSLTSTNATIFALGLAAILIIMSSIYSYAYIKK
jgi:hypothetical protein